MKREAREARKKAFWENYEQKVGLNRAQYRDLIYGRVKLKNLNDIDRQILENYEEKLALREAD